MQSATQSAERRASSGRRTSRLGFPLLSHARAYAELQWESGFLDANTWTLEKLFETFGASVQALRAGEIWTTRYTLGVEPA